MDTKNEARNFQTNHWIIDKNILSTNWKNNKKTHYAQNQFERENVNPSTTWSKQPKFLECNYSF